MLMINKTAVPLQLELGDERSWVVQGKDEESANHSTGLRMRSRNWAPGSEPLSSEQSYPPKRHVIARLVFELEQSELLELLNYSRVT